MANMRERLTAKAIELGIRKPKPAKPEPVFDVVVGNVGTVYSGTDFYAACMAFGEYRELSRTMHGRAAGEDVTLMQDGEPIREYDGETTNIY